jgi:hypothetical protein
VAPDVTLTRNRTPDSAAPDEVVRLFHRLNNQLGVILANAELLEHRLADNTLRVRAEQVVAGTLEAINTAQQLRKETLTVTPAKNPAV